MVIAAAGVKSEDVLDGLSVRDSKLLTARQRESLCSAIRERCRIATVIIPADRIDAHRAAITMNECVARAHAAAIRKIRPSKAYVDACDVNAGRYAQMVRSHLKKPCTIVAEHHADSTYRIVSAASIVAKVVRDAEISRLSEEFGPIGSGYPSDPETIAYLTSYIRKHNRPPPIARRSWKTVVALLDRQAQTQLPDFS
jgi:ribonuclease HII